MHRLKRALAGAMAALLVMQCVPYATLADEPEPAASTVETESTDVLSTDTAPQQDETDSEMIPDSDAEAEEPEGTTPVEQ